MWPFHLFACMYIHISNIKYLGRASVFPLFSSFRALLFFFSLSFFSCTVSFLLPCVCVWFLFIRQKKQQNVWKRDDFNRNIIIFFELDRRCRFQDKSRKNINEIIWENTRKENFSICDRSYFVADQIASYKAGEEEEERERWSAINHSLFVLFFFLSLNRHRSISSLRDMLISFLSTKKITVFESNGSVK